MGINIQTIYNLSMTSYTRKGDDGYTSLLGEGRVPKYHPRPTAYGCVDEASAALGLARAMARSKETQEVVRVVQKDLYHIMAEIAATPENSERFQVIDAERVEWLEFQIDSFEKKVAMPRAFILSGDTPAEAALDLARTVIRRAEREVARLHHDGELKNPHLLRYLNRLSSLCFVLSIWENRKAGFEGPSLVKAEPA
jgi:cob(I)alamin adenosyltransferase